MSDCDPTLFETDELLDVLDRVRKDEDLYAVSERVAKVGHYRWNRDKDCLESCSQQYANAFGLDAAQVIAKQSSLDSLLEFIHPGDRERYRQACDDASPERHLDIEYRVVTDDNRARYLREVGIYVAPATRSTRADFGVVQDVTRRVEQGRNLQQRNDLALQAENLFDIGHYIFDEESQSYLYLSEGFARIHGTTVAEHLETTQSFEDDLEQIAEIDRERVAAAYQHYIDTGDALDIEYRIVHPDGTLRWLREQNRARSMKNGKVRHTLGVLQDITRQKEIELELRYKDSLAAQAEIVTEMGHFVFDEISDRYVFASPGLARIYGVDTDFLLNQLQSTADDMEFVHPDDRKMVQALYDEEAEVDADGYHNWQLEYRMVRPNGDIRWVREVGKTHVIEAGVDEQTIGVVIDITEQKNAEQKIIEARDNLEREVAERTRELADTVEQLEQEITERKKIAAELQFLADHDALTELAGLRLGRDRLQQAIIAANRRDEMVAVLFLDLDGFKAVNDQHGHEAGDKVLKIVADRLRTQVREDDTVARIGGDEFLVILPGIPQAAIADKIATKLIRVVDREIGIREIRVRIGVSIGIALYPENGRTSDTLIQAADKAMYQVKQRGKNDFGYAGLKTGRKIVDPDITQPDRTE